MVSGRQTLGSIDHALGDLRREETELTNRIDRATKAISELHGDQSDAYRDLARFRLDQDGSATLGSRLDKTSRKARKLLEQRAGELQKIGEENRQVETARAERQRDRDSLVDARNAMADRLDDLMEQVDEALEKSADYARQQAQVDQAQATANAAREKAQTALEDQETKGKAYLDDPLFVYLWERDFGTSSYDKTGLVRSLDRWVAGLIKFHDARPNYAMLTQIPDRLEKHAVRCAADAEREVARLTDISRGVAKDLAGEDLAAKLDDQERQITAVDVELEKLDARLDHLADTIRAFANGEDKSFVEAEDLLSRSLKSDDLDQLWREAIATPSPEDEKIVRRIEKAGERIEMLAREVRQDRELQRDLSRRREELTKVSRKFRKNGYDSWDSEFSDNNLTTVLLGELVKGAITGADYWSRAKRTHKRRRPKGGRVGFPGGTGLPTTMGGGWGSSGGWGSGSSGGSWGGGSSGGSSGGDGFTTGDTF